MFNGGYQHNASRIVALSVEGVCRYVDKKSEMSFFDKINLKKVRKVREAKRVCSTVYLPGRKRASKAPKVPLVALLGKKAGSI